MLSHFFRSLALSRGSSPTPWKTARAKFADDVSDSVVKNGRVKVEEKLLYFLRRKWFMDTRGGTHRKLFF